MRFVIAALALGLAACGGGGNGGGSMTVGLNEAPVFTSQAAVSTPERTTGPFYTAAATVAGGRAASFTLAGGADMARFSISSGGALSFIVAPDFEAPTDADLNNVYLVTIGVSDGQATTTMALSVTVTDVPGVLAMRRVGAGFDQPLFLTGAGDTSGRVLVVEKPGRIRVLNPATGAISANLFLDVSTAVATDGERGLVGLALAPDFATSRTFYVYLVNTAGGIEVRRYRTLASDPLRADATTADVILTIAHPPNAFHNGGWIGFGADGMLWIAVGDGATGGAPSQDRNDLLGKVLRIDPRTDSFPSDPNRDYAIPAGNPFTPPTGAPEVYALGLRNPFRGGFDRQTGDLYIADVGQSAIEEVDLLRAGGADAGRNFGWNILEGTAPYAGGSTAGLSPPILQYPHGTGPLQGNSVTGGYVYRGPIAQFRGNYVFGDFINRRIWTVPVASVAQGTTLANTAFVDRTAAFTPDVGTIGNIPSFGEDELGNLFVVDFDGDIFMLREQD